MTSQMILALVAILLGSNVVAVLVTLYFTRGKTKAETTKILADAHKTDAEAEETYLEQFRKQFVLVSEYIPKLEAASAAWITCQREKVEEQIKRREAEADKERTEQYAESLRLQVADYQKRETEMMGELRKAREELAAKGI